jgi:hypothetical protein
MIPRSSELRGVRGAEGRSFAVRLGQSVGKPHDAEGVVAVAETIRVAELMDRFGRAAAGKESFVG